MESGKYDFRPTLCDLHSWMWSFAAESAIIFNQEVMCYAQVVG
jgi:hypothetical protein